MADLTITVASVLKVSGNNGNGVAGATITAGQPLYKNADGKYYPADCVTSQATAVVVGIALHGSLAGQPIAFLKNGGVLAIGATIVAGTQYVLSETGKIAPAADLASLDKISYVGVALTAANLQIDINNTGIVHA